MSEKTLLVSLISDQTIPNLQLIKEFGDRITNHLFISTNGMENKGVRKWLEQSCGIDDKVREFIIVDEYSYINIKSNLEKIDFSSYDKIIVNLTGGTKVMTMSSQDFFREKPCEIYYVTANSNNYVQVFPNNITNKFTSKVSLKEYLTAYGITVKESEPSGIDKEYTKKLFNKYNNLNLNDYTNEFKLIRERRGKSISGENFEKTKRLLLALDYPINNQRLSPAETKYLSGDWFEEYIGNKIQDELNLSNQNIYISTEISKEYLAKDKNNPSQLIGEEIESKAFDNEMDVMFIYENNFYSIECKTSIQTYTYIETNGEIKEKETSILGETIYKSDSLKNRFGLYPRTTILTLTDFNNYCHNCSAEMKKSRMNAMTDLIKRANLSNIKLVDLKMLLESNSVFQLIK